MPGNRTMSASEFKAKCLDVLDRIRSKELERVVVTKRGLPVAVLVPPPADAGESRAITRVFTRIRRRSTRD
jgi:prevent-host-death family protein